MPASVLLALLLATIAVAVVLLVLWLRAARRLRALQREAASTASDVAHLEFAVADRSGRLRIVRELHDLAVHRVSSMVAQADGAGYAGAVDPTAAVRAVQAIADLGRATLADLRRVVTVVHDGEDPASSPLRSTEELFGTMRDAGLVIEVEEAGEPYPLGPGAGLAVHGIVQEALRNSLQHGGAGTTVRSSFSWTATGLTVRLEDDGFRNAVLARGLTAEQAAEQLGYTARDDLHALTRAVTGPTIREMRARAELFGGSLTAIETPGVGFGVTAAFPTIRHHNGVHGVDLTTR